MASSLNGTGLTFSSGQTLNAVPVTSFIGQTGAVDPTALGAIGSVQVLFSNNTTILRASSTVAGSTLFYPSGTITGSQNNIFYTESSPGSGVIPISTYNMTGLITSRIVNGNGGFFLPAGNTTMSGTWRCLGMANIRGGGYDSCANQTGWTFYGAYFVRIS